jgi:hypothetical protein
MACQLRRRARALYDLGKAGWARLGTVLFKQADEAGAAVSAGRALVDSTPELRSIAGEAAGINIAGQVRAGRTTLQWADPGLAWTFVGTGVVLDGFAYGVLKTASVGPPPDGSAPPPAPHSADTNELKND